MGLKLGKLLHYIIQPLLDRLHRRPRVIRQPQRKHLPILRTAFGKNIHLLFDCSSSSGQASCPAADRQFLERVKVNDCIEDESDVNEGGEHAIKLFEAREDPSEAF